MDKLVDNPRATYTRNDFHARDVPRSCTCGWEYRPQLGRWVRWWKSYACPWHSHG